MDKQGFTTYLENRDLSKSSINCYIKHTVLFLEWVKKEEIQVTKPDILKFLEYLKNERGQQNITRSNYLIAVNHYFSFLYQEGLIAKNACSLLKIRGIKRKMLYKIYTPEELDGLCDNYCQLFVHGYNDRHIPQNQRKQSVLNRERNAVILSILTNQGVVTSEIGKIELEDLDLMKATLKIRGKRVKERTLPLKASQIGLLMFYLQNTRPKILEYYTIESNKLFLLLPKTGNKTTDNDTVFEVFKPLIKQVRTIDKKFLNFQQVRASVITFWLKTQGLRKAQYLAGHRYIHSTEEYLPNNLDGLIDDINKLHPF